MDDSNFYMSTALMGSTKELFIQEKCCSACGDDHGEQEAQEEARDYVVELPVIDPETGKQKKIKENLKGAYYVLCPKTNSKVYLIWG